MGGILKDLNQPNKGTAVEESTGTKVIEQSA